MKALQEIIQEGWPPSKLEAPEIVHPYFNIRDELTIQDELVFKGHSVIIPAAMRKHMMSVVHATHIGVEGCISKSSPQKSRPLESGHRRYAVWVAIVSWAKKELKFLCRQSHFVIS